MEYAEAMCRTPVAVTEEMVDTLLPDLGPAGVLELTCRVGVMNMTARGNVALGIGGWSESGRSPSRKGSLSTACRVRRSPRTCFMPTLQGRGGRCSVASGSRSRPEYVGPWLPEPLLTSPDVAEDVELADSLSTAMLLVLETLAPIERAVFVLREVFDLPYDELAAAVGRTPAAVRQIAHRARAHVAERRPRGAVSHADTRLALAAFQRAIDTGDIQQLVDLLAPDVVALGDGGGIKQAMPRPVAGADKVGRLLGAGIALMAGRMTAEPTHVNGWPGLLLRLDGEVDSVMTVRVEDGLVTGIYTVRNPEKLSRVLEEAEVGR